MISMISSEKEMIRHKKQNTSPSNVRKKGTFRCSGLSYVSLPIISRVEGAASDLLKPIQLEVMNGGYVSQETT